MGCAFAAHTEADRLFNLSWTELQDAKAKAGTNYHRFALDYHTFGTSRYLGDATVERARWLRRTGQFDEAEQGLRASLAINPLHEEGIRLLADLYGRGIDGPWKDGTLFELAVAHFPRREDYWSALGTVRFRLGRPARAADAFARAVALNADARPAAEGSRP